jgi:hypothetical protein
MRKRFYALPVIAAALSPLLARAADVCSRVSGKGLMDGVCQECYSNGQCQIADFFIVGNTVTKLILGLSGSIMLLMVVYGGFLWLASSGNSSMVEKGKKVLIGALIGLIIVFGAYTATQFLVASLVCTAGQECTAVNEIFARPFQLVKPPGTTTKPPATTPSPGATTPTAPSGNTASCVCSITYNYASNKVTGNVFQLACGNGSRNGISCTMSGDACVCNGPSSASQDKCTSIETVNNFAMPIIDGITTSGGCNWSASQ